MWVFGYGSLMWDGWELCFHGTKHDRAKLSNFHRDFNKRSIENRGTPKQPCPTLGLVNQRGTECIGSVFFFEDKWKRAVLAYLRVREGSSFKLVKKKIVLDDGNIVLAFTPTNNLSSTTYVGDRSIKERAQMARMAKGTNGSCFDYVRNIKEKLASLQITDKFVDQMWAALQ